LACDNPELDRTKPENDLETKSEVEDTKLQSMSKVHDVLEIWHSSQNLCATERESCPLNEQMTAVKYISDTEEIIKASWSNDQHDGAAEFQFTDSSPLPPARSIQDLHGG